MIAEVNPSHLQGSVAAPPSKSAAHRYLIASFLSWPTWGTSCYSAASFAFNCCICLCIILYLFGLYVLYIYFRFWFIESH